MLEREKIIKGFTVCSEHGLLNGEDCHGYYAYTDNLEDIIKANDYSKQCPYNGCETGCVKTLAKDISALLEEQNWVKCSDRMPEEHDSIFAKFKDTDKWSPAMFARSSEDVRVVIVFDDGTRRVSHSHTIDGKWECEKSPLKRTVTHWMPNPKLPKEER